MTSFTIFTKCPRTSITKCTCSECDWFKKGDIVKSHIDPFKDLGLVRAIVLGVARAHSNTQFPYFHLRVIKVINPLKDHPMWNQIGMEFYRFSQSMWKHDPNDIQFYTSREEQ